MPDQLRLPFEPLFTIKQAASATGLQYWLILHAINKGDIPFYSFGNKRRRVRLSDIEAAMTAASNSEAG